MGGVGGTGSPRGFVLMGLKEHSLGEEKKRLGASMGLRNLVSCVGSGKHRLLSLARRKLGASGGLESLPCRLASAGAALGGCLPPKHLLPSGLGWPQLVLTLLPLFWEGY